MDDTATYEIRLISDALKTRNGNPNAVPDTQSENVHIMMHKQEEVLRSADFHSLFSLTAEGYLQYRLFERFEDLLIYATSDTSSGATQTLSSLAKRDNMRYILNFPRVDTRFEQGAWSTTIEVQLYDDLTKQVLFQRSCVGDDRNPGFEFTCQQGTIECTVNNALAQVLDEIARTVALRDPEVIRENELAEERASVLSSTYFTRTPDTSIVRIIQLRDTSISTNGFYQGFMDESRTKFIAFFLVEKRAGDLFDRKQEAAKNVTVEMNEMDIFSAPSMRASVVVGIQHEARWSIKEQEVIYFEAEDMDSGRRSYFYNLQRWGFFEDERSTPSEHFWETHFFERIPDLRKDPDWDKYGQSIWKLEEERNRPYIGMYRIVAEELMHPDRR